MRDLRGGAAAVVRSFDGPVGAYVHVPFCERICPFCPYNKVVAEDALARRYFAALHREIDAYAAELASIGHGPFTSLYIGGGTPTLYPEELGEVVRRLPVSGERAVEVLPTHGTPERLDRLSELGFTSVSIGAQSFHDEVLHRLRRPHDAAASRSATENALGRFDSVDVDLIVDVEWEDGGLSGAFLEDVRTCFELGVDQVSTYPLMRFGYTPFGTGGHNRHREHEVLRQATALAEVMGYERRSVWTFNKPGSAPYTSITRPRFLGMGAGSSSFAGRDFYVNHFGVGVYCDAVEAGQLPVARRMGLGRWAGAAYDTFWQAYAGGVDLRAVAKAYGGAAAALTRAGLAPLALAGLVRPGPRRWELTPRGFDVYHDLERLVTYQLIEPLWAEMLREHTVAPCAAAAPHDLASGVSTGRAHWVRPEQARGGRLWSGVRRALESPL
jgi:oxygen-independent coproporphyrinogen-3 oxidase